MNSRLRRSRRSPRSTFPSLRLWARLRPHAPGEIEPPALATPQPTPAGPALDLHTGTPVLPQGQARPSASPALILPLLVLTFALALPTRASAFSAFSAVEHFRLTACTHRPASHRAYTSRPVQALTGNPVGPTECRDCSDLCSGRLAPLSLPLDPQIPTINRPHRPSRLSPAINHQLPARRSLGEGGSTVNFPIARPAASRSKAAARSPRRWGWGNPLKKTTGQPRFNNHFTNN